MARPKKWASDAQRKEAKLEAQRMRREAKTPVEAEIEAETPSIEVLSGFVRFRHHPQVPLSLFDGVGRGSPKRHSDGAEYVLVARHEGPHLGEMGVVTADDWWGRLRQRCEHGFAGWSCHVC